MSTLATALGSAGCQPAVLGSLPSTTPAGKLPTGTGWQPALPRENCVTEYAGISSLSHDE